MSHKLTPAHTEWERKKKVQLSFMRRKKRPDMYINLLLFFNNELYVPWSQKGEQTTKKPKITTTKNKCYCAINYVEFNDALPQMWMLQFIHSVYQQKTGWIIHATLMKRHTFAHINVLHMHPQCIVYLFVITVNKKMCVCVPFHSALFTTQRWSWCEKLFRIPSMVILFFVIVYFLSHVLNLKFNSF